MAEGLAWRISVVAFPICFPKKNGANYQHYDTEFSSCSPQPWREPEVRPSQSVSTQLDPAPLSYCPPWDPPVVPESSWQVTAVRTSGQEGGTAGLRPHFVLLPGPRPRSTLRFGGGAQAKPEGHPSPESWWMGGTDVVLAKIPACFDALGTPERSTQQHGRHQMASAHGGGFVGSGRRGWVSAGAGSGGFGRDKRWIPLTPEGTVLGFLKHA